MGTYDAIDVARVIINECVDNGIEITHLKLQKLLYYVQGHYLAKYGEPIFDEEIRAWKLGPVVEEVYSVFSLNASFPLKRQSVFSNIEQEENIVNMVKWAVGKYANMPIWDLVYKTHEETPWKIIWNDKTSSNNIMSKQSIKEFFKHN